MEVFIGYLESGATESMEGNEDLEDIIAKERIEYIWITCREYRTLRSWMISNDLRKFKTLRPLMSLTT